MAQGLVGELDEYEVRSGGCLQMQVVGRRICRLIPTWRAMVATSTFLACRGHESARSVSTRS